MTHEPLFLDDEDCESGFVNVYACPEGYETGSAWPTREDAEIVGRKIVAYRIRVQMKADCR